MGHYVILSTLPKSLQLALEEAGYHRKDIEVRVQEEFEPRPPSAHGRRGFVAACRLDDTNKFEITWGSYGGSNMFTQTVDDFQGSAPIPPEVAFISGMGNAGAGYPAYASIYVNPKSMDPSLLPVAASVTEKEAKILAIFKSLKSSYRQGYLDRAKATSEEVTSLVERGFLSRNKAGATSITTTGRNAAGKEYS